MSGLRARSDERARRAIRRATERSTRRPPEAAVPPREGPHRHPRDAAGAVPRSRGRPDDTGLQGPGDDRPIRRRRTPSWPRSPPAPRRTKPRAGRPSPPPPRPSAATSLAERRAGDPPVEMAQLRERCLELQKDLDTVAGQAAVATIARAEADRMSRRARPGRERGPRPNGSSRRRIVPGPRRPSGWSRRCRAARSRSGARRPRRRAAADRASEAFVGPAGAEAGGRHPSLDRAATRQLRVGGAVRDGPSLAAEGVRSSRGPRGRPRGRPT